MPTTALSLIYLAFYMRLMRTSVLEVADLDYVRTARAKGASGARLMFHHIMRNAFLPVVTLLGLQFSTVLGGSVVIETIFSLPGLGQLAYTSVIKRDLNTLMGIIFLCSVLVVIVNFITDLIYARLDSGSNCHDFTGPLPHPPAGLARKILWQRFSRNRAAVLGLILFIAVVLIALLADVITPGDPLRRAGDPLVWPFVNAATPLGTDQLGRDIMAGIFHGARISLLIGVVATLISIVIGIIIGALAGYYGGWVDDVLMRITEAFQTVPSFVLLLTLVAIFGSSIENIIICIGIVSWTAPARMVRAEFLALRKREFIDAARNLGVGNVSIIFREILPNALPPVIVFASVVMATSILMESALAFLGLGDPNYASWGNMIGQGRAVLRTDWFCSVIPGIAILLTVLSFSLLGEGLNDALNPRQKK